MVRECLVYDTVKSVYDTVMCGVDTAMSDVQYDNVLCIMR